MPERDDAGRGEQALIAIHEVGLASPGTGFVIGGRGLMSRLRSRPGIDVCERVSDVVEAVDAMVQHADQN